MENLVPILDHAGRLADQVLPRPPELVPEPRDRCPTDDRLESETPWFLEEEVTPWAAVGQSRIPIGSLLAIVVNDEERRLIASGGHRSEKPSGLAGSHFRRNGRPLVSTRIERRLCDGPSLVDEGL